MNKLIIQEGDDDHDKLLEFVKIQTVDSFEQLIELFEFVISPEEKIVNGAVYTPEYIREYIVRKSFESHAQEISDLQICDPACGCAGFLYTTAQILREETQSSYKEIFKNQLFGLDTEEYSVERSKLLLLLLAISEGEDLKVYDFNLYKGNALDFNWRTQDESFEGFDIVVGNPPYVCSRNMVKESLDLVKNWSVSQSGHPDLYIPFFQLGYEILKPKGILGYITVNTFIKSVNGRSLRNYFSSNRVDIKIINFGGEQIFKNRSTYTCICFLQNSIGSVRYKKALSADLNKLRDNQFIRFDYDSLADNDGWNLVESVDQTKYINKIESVGTPLKNRFVTRNGIATLANYIYKFFPVSEDENYYTLRTKEGKDYPIEKDICRDIANPNKLRSEKQLKENTEKIIFPYESMKNELIVLDENTFINKYPLTYKYLSDHKVVLRRRDKGNKKYEKWYAYGRRQSMDINAYKLFFPHISERPSFTISKDKALLFYSGIAIVSESLKELKVLKRIMESDVFFDYIKNMTKDYSSGYISMSKNYIKNFGICKLSKFEENELLESDNPELLIRNYYGLDSTNMLYTNPQSVLSKVAESNIGYR
ncbi:MAG: SAM-dependent DNA methyltransferase [Flavobacteriales bacterium]|nr:SAM-dependent DNA methyltransferase [Flavobacteriales bacterium]